MTKTKRKSREQHLKEVLESKSFDELRQEGAILDIEQAAARTGYDTSYLRRLCQARKLHHFVRGDTQYYFLPEYLAGVFKFVQAQD